MSRRNVSRALALFLALSVVPGTRIASRSFLFPASRVPSAPVPDDFDRYVLTARDGETVHAVGLAAPPGAHTVVFFHNNRETIAASTSLARTFHERGLGVLLVEYRGYGDSRAGTPTEEGLYLDAESALDFLATRGVGPDRIVLFGTSLGTGVAAEMARRGRGAKLVLVTPYTSIPEIVTDVVPVLPASVLVPDHFDTLSKAAEIRVPTLVIHGDADEIVPFWMGERIASAIHGARFVRVAGAHHGDLFARDGARLISEIAVFGG